MRLQTRILAFLLPPALLAGAGLALLSRREVGRILREQVSQRGVSIAQDLATRGRDAVASREEGRLLPLLQSALPRGALYALALDGGGRVLAHTNVAETGKTYDDPPTLEALRAPAPAVRPASFDGKAVLEVTVPVWASPGAGQAEEDLLSSWAKGHRRRSGALRVGLPLKEAEDTQRDIARRVFLVMAGIGTLLLALVLLMIRRLLQPVDALVGVTDRLARGEFGVEAPGAGPGDLGRLAASFNRLSRDLKNQICERQRAQEQLLQSQKMDVIGQLAGGVAHDFNNLLTVIQGYAHFLLHAPDDAENVRLGLDQINQASEHASSLTRQLLAFSRKQVLQPAVMCLNAAIERTGRMMRRLVGESVKIENALDPSLAFLKADPGQIEQVILNLVVNARDAMPEGGVIRLETANVTERGSEDVPDGRWVRLTVADQGVGMDRDLVARIFEPFFTTKPPGKGTGLGLSTVMGIIKQSGGHLSVDSSPGRGSAFHVYLPPCDEVPAPAPETGTDWPAGGRETVLVVEDDPRVRLFTRRVLEQAGYTVLEAAEAGQALIVLQEQGKAPDLLLTDAVMPGMNGRQLAERVTAAAKGVRTLFMSGHTEDALLLSGVRSRGTAFLAKPFTPEKLLKKVREVLDAPGG